MQNYDYVSILKDVKTGAWELYVSYCDDEYNQFEVTSTDPNFSSSQTQNILN
ncbi:hypothetical protein CLOSBL3_11840 [Clostridiaceae bacterium BL-3]|nr:hypothetical protein CLOSBL3_11840 [Clostridiaceae bacterium BL-3]